LFSGFAVLDDFAQLDERQMLQKPMISYVRISEYGRVEDLPLDNEKI
jgi:hypothetical protein